MTSRPCPSMLTQTDGCSCTHVHFPATHALVRASVSTHGHTHTHACSHTQAYTQMAQQPGMAPNHTFSSPGQDAGVQPLDLLAPCSVMCLSFPSWHSPAPPLPQPWWAPGWQGRAGQAGVLPGPGAGTGTISQNQAPAITSRFGSQTPQCFLSPSQTIHHGASSHYGKQHSPHLFPASPTSIMVKSSHSQSEGILGDGDTPRVFLIWDMPARPPCSDHPRSEEQCHHQILAVPLPPHATHSTGSPMPEHRHRSTAPHTMFPASCCPHAGLSDSVSPLFKGRYTPSFVQAVLVQGRREGAGCVCHIHTSVYPSNRPSWREGGSFAKQGKIPEQRHRAQEGPYMGMGTVLCFPADECAAALAPPQPPTGTRHPTSITVSTKQKVPPLFPHHLSGRMET